MKDITVFIPTYNNSTTILITLKSLQSQSCKHIKKIIVIDDGSTDNTVKLINRFSKESKYNTKVIQNKQQSGLSEKYNKIIFSVDTPYLLLMHADVKILDKNAVDVFYKNITKKGVAACVGFVAHSFSDWIKYSFWQKVEFDRKITRTLQGINGKFDMFSVKHLKKVGGFDTKNFYRAGEDWDMYFRIQDVGKVAMVDCKYLHQHSFNKNYGLKNLIQKQAMLSQAAAVVFKKHYKKFSLKLILFTFFREFMVLFILSNIVVTYKTNNLTLLLPSAALLIFYIIAYAKNTFKYEYKNPNILVLPFVLVYLIFVSNFYTLQSLITGRQTV